MRPLIGRPTVRGLDGPAPVLSAPGAPPLALGTPEFDAAVSRLGTFGVEDGALSYLVISERRSRGNRYWVARGYRDGRRASSYIGRKVDAARLREASAEIGGRLSAPAPAASDGAAVKAVLDGLLARETDPARRAAAQAIADFVLTGGKVPPLP